MIIPSKGFLQTTIYISYTFIIIIIVKKYFVFVYTYILLYTVIFVSGKNMYVKKKPEHNVISRTFGCIFVSTFHQSVIYTVIQLLFLFFFFVFDNKFAVSTPRFYRSTHCARNSSRPCGRAKAIGWTTPKAYTPRQKYRTRRKP